MIVLYIENIVTLSVGHEFQ